MKKITNLLIVLIVIGFGNYIKAQPTITSVANPNAGDEITVHSLGLPNGTISPGPAGASITWDFSDLAATTTQFATFMNATVSGYGDDFPGAELALMYEQGLRYGTPVLNYEFYKPSDNGLSHVGLINSAQTNVFYNDEQEILPYPFTYGDMSSDVFSSDFIVSNIPFERDGMLNLEADAYGTLILPSGTVNNVLRVKTTIDYQDVSSLPDIDYAVETYAWYKTGYAFPILVVSTETVSSSPQPFQTVFYAETPNNDPGVGINDKPKLTLDFTAHPNPTQDVSNLRYALNKTTGVSLAVYDLTGKKIAFVDNGTQTAGTHTYALNLSNKPKGVYLVELNVDGERNTLRVLLR